MAEIVLTEEQALIIAQSREMVLVRNPQGQTLGVIDPTDAIAVAKSKQRSGNKQPNIPGEKVQSHLQALQDEWDRTGGFDEVQLKAFVAKLRAEDQQ